MIVLPSTINTQCCSGCGNCGKNPWVTRTKYDKCKSELKKRDDIISAKEKELRKRDDSIEKKDEIIKNGAVTTIANEREIKTLREQLKAEKEAHKRFKEQMETIRRILAEMTGKRREGKTL